MAREAVGIDISLIAAADLSAKQYFGIKIDSAGKAALAGAGEAIGVLQNNPTSGQAAVVRVGGISKMFAAGNIAAGAYVTSDSAGKFTTATKATTKTDDAGVAADALVGSLVTGQALDGAAANDIFAGLIIQMGAVPTTLA